MSNQAGERRCQDFPFPLHQALLREVLIRDKLSVFTASKETEMTDTRQTLI